MARIVFTPNIQRHLQCPPVEVSGSTVAEALDALFVINPRARDYILDNQGAVRQHMVIFVNGAGIHDRTGLSDRLAENTEIYIAQALSGG
jgi:molybdopterin converting factor small subunit